MPETSAFEICQSGLVASVMQELSNFINALSRPVAVADLTGRILFHNPSFAAHCAQADRSLIDTSLLSLWEPSEISEFESFLESLKDSACRLPNPIVATRSLTAKLVSFDTGDHILCEARDPVSIATKPSEPPQNDDKLMQLNSKIKLAVDVAGIGTWEFDPKTSRVFWDDRMLAIYGLPAGENERCRTSWEQFIHPDDRKESVSYIQQCTAEKSDIKHDFRIIRPDGEVRHLRTLARFQRLSSSESRMIGVNIDVTEDVQRTQELERTRKTLEYDSKHDALTGLANRRLLDETFASVLPEGGSREICALHMDLDHFKEINDRVGHSAGDAVLVHVAHTLRHILNNARVICRLGGDEFFALFAPAPPPEKIRAMAEQVISAFKAPYLYKGRACAFGISIGSATGRDPKVILTRSDIALYNAKNAGRACYHAFAERASADDGRYKRRQDLVDALSENRIECWYQPQFDAQTYQLAGAEALARLRTETGVFAPEDFLPLAEETGLLASIEEFIFQRALEDQNQWAKAGLGYPTVSVNLSKHQLSDASLVARITEHIRPHHTLSLELLETAFLDDPDTLEHETIDKLRRLGISVELDDFGSGHASLVAMMSVAPDRIKIDQRLTRNIATHPKELEMLKALVAIARMQDIGVVLEGIESPEQLEATRDIKCDKLQGYALSPPISAEDFSNMLEDNRKLAGKA